MSFSLSPMRAASVACDAMVATSQPLATLSGLDVLREGGNAVDAAVCAAAVLCVTEPDATGVGGDLLALVREPDGRLHGLDAAGPAPMLAPREPPAQYGPRSIDVPGAVAGWGELARRFGRIGLERCLRPAAEFADAGVAAGFNAARLWRMSPHAPAELGPAPAFGSRYRLPELAVTMRGIMSEGPEFLYAGPPAAAIAAATWLTAEDLGRYRPRWVEPLTHPYRGLDVAELPPPNQGVVALEALAILGDEDARLREQVAAVALALEDGLLAVRDGADVRHLLSTEHIRRRRTELPVYATEPPGGTVCVCVVDRDRLAVSLMQSLYEPFGSGVVAAGTGIVLNNRASAFAVQGEVLPGTRPYHTLIPGMLSRGKQLVGPFAIMGGFVQAQAHVRFLAELTRGGPDADTMLDPQPALDRGRFRVEGRQVRLEEPLWEHVGELESLGLQVIPETERSVFGGGQAITVHGGTLFGGSDARKDGCALGI